MKKCVRVFHTIVLFVVKECQQSKNSQICILVDISNVSLENYFITYSETVKTR